MSTEIYEGPISANEFFGGKELGVCVQMTDTGGTTSHDPGAGIFIQGRKDDALACAKAIVAFYDEPFEEKAERAARAIHERMVYGNTDARALAEEALRAAGLSEDPSHA